jgi:uncharacterized protein YqfB (UPF0267 family)
MGEMRNGFFVADTIAFSNNWNNKLANKAFTTIRLHNDSKYEIGKVFKITLKDRMLGTAELYDKRVIRLDQLNSFITMLDTGYDVTETTNIIKNMYKNSNPPIDWSRQLLDFCLLLYQREKNHERITLH